MTYCSVVAVLVLVGLTKKRFGHDYTILKILSLRSPSEQAAFPLYPIMQWTESYIRLCAPFSPVFTSHLLFCGRAGDSNFN